MIAQPRRETLAELVLRVARERQAASDPPCAKSEKSEKGPEPTPAEGPNSLNSLCSHPDENINSWTDENDQRAEFDAGIPRAWSNALARLDHGSPPADVPPKRWFQFIDDAGRFASDWGEKAIKLGWEPQDIFGCDRDRPFARIDRAGLVWLLNGWRVVILTSELAVIETPSGSRQTYRRRNRNPGEVVLAWELIPRC